MDSYIVHVLRKIAYMVASRYCVLQFIVLECPANHRSSLFCNRIMLGITATIQNLRDGEGSDHTQDSQGNQELSKGEGELFS